MVLTVVTGRFSGGFGGRRKCVAGTCARMADDTDLEFLTLKAAIKPAMQYAAPRALARSLMSRARILPHVAEQVLGHVIPGVMGTYDRHSYDDEKADALNRLACLVEKIANPPTDNVIPLQK